MRALTACRICFHARRLPPKPDSGRNKIIKHKHTLLAIGLYALLPQKPGNVQAAHSAIHNTQIQLAQCLIRRLHFEFNSLMGTTCKRP